MEFSLLGMPNLEQKTEKVIEEAAKDLSVDLPKVDIPIVLKMIALFTLIGGLSIIGSSFADVFSTYNISPIFYSLRLISGMTAIVVAYGIIKRKQWSLFLYTVLVGIGFIFNPIISIFPALVAVFLFYHWHDFKPKTFKIHEENLGKLDDLIKKVIRFRNNDKKS